MSRGRAAAVVVVAVAGVGFLIGTQSPRRPRPIDRGARRAAVRGDRPLVIRPGTSPVARPPAGAPRSVQADPERLDPTLGQEHRRALGERPVFQHLPYRNREIGVNFDRVVGGGRLELLVTYVGSRARAVRDLRRLLARYGDPGTAYVERYEPVFQ